MVADTNRRRLVEGGPILATSRVSPMLAEVLDLGIDLNAWPWVWLVVAVFVAVIELTVLAGSFVLLPFSISAFAASLLGFYDVAIEIQWFVFIFGGAAIWIALYRYVKRFAGQNEIAPGVGAERLIGLTGIVTTRIDPDDTARLGRVAIDSEVWGALCDDHPIDVGARVRVVEMHGTRVRVVAAEATSIEPSVADESPTPEDT
jgi:membrane protein implicated in regulation of membrane protease activity